MQLAKRPLAVAVAAALFQPLYYANLNEGSIVPGRGGAAATFVRATTGTFHDGDRMVRTALAAEARLQGLRRVQNYLVTPNEDFTLWTKINAGTGTVPVVTGGFQAPDGSNTAYRVQVSGGGIVGNYSSIRKVGTGLPATGQVINSVWIKSNTGAPVTVALNLGAGLGTAGMTIAGSAWQRMATPAFPVASAFMDIGVGDGNPTSAAADVLVWHPQEEWVTGQFVQAPGEYTNVGVLAAPYYGANVDGVRYLPFQNGNVIQQNLIVQSQAIDDAAWTKRGVVAVTPNATAAPDGTLTADLISGVNVAGVDDFFNAGYVGVTAAPNIRYTPSFYIKRVSTVGTLQIGNPSNGNTLGQWRIDLSLLSNGWERITESHPAVTIVVPFMSSPTGNGVGMLFNASAGGPLSFYLWGAQANNGIRAATYVASGAAVLSNNIVEEQAGPPFPSTSPFKGFLCESQKTNLALQSQTIGVAPWGSAFLNPYVANATIAPDGTTTASKIVEDATVAQVHQAAQSFVMTDNLDYTFSVYLKAAERTWAQVFLVAKTGGQRNAYFNLTTGAIGAVSGGTTASIVALANGWYRCTVTMNAGVGAGGQAAWIGLATGDNGGTYNGDGVSGIYAWGAHVEQASLPTSYVPTVAATVTRNLDSLKYTSYATATSFSLFAMWQANGTEGAGSFPPVSVNDGTANNRVQIFMQDPGRTIQCGVVSGGVVQANFGTRTPGVFTTIKACVSVTSGAQELVVNAAAAETAAGTPVAASTQLWIGGDPNTTQCCGVIAKVALYNRLLSTAYKRTLTT